jgi:hypothetical protein
VARESPVIESSSGLIKGASRATALLLCPARAPASHFSLSLSQKSRALRKLLPPLHFATKTRCHKANTHLVPPWQEYSSTYSRRTRAVFNAQHWLRCCSSSGAFAFSSKRIRSVPLRCFSMHQRYAFTNASLLLHFNSLTSHHSLTLTTRATACLSIIGAVSHGGRSHGHTCGHGG